MPKREIERKLREEQEATAFAFQEFINTFQDSSGPPNKLFVRAGILNAATGHEDTQTGQIYAPSALVKPSSNTLKNAIECARLVKESKLETRTKNVEKPKSNLELLKEELRQRHLERDARNKITKEFENSASPHGESTDSKTTTNLFVANLNPKLTENDLVKIFGGYGPLASVKIMWPRSEDKNRNVLTNCGFVAYMSRKDAERALEVLKHREDMRVGWGKPVEVPLHPIYIPPELLNLLLPPPPPYTGLPFNAQPIKMPLEPIRNEEDFEKLLYNSYVKVTIPSDKKMLMVIHHTVEYVINEGPMFEAMLMNNEINNANYQFLFDNRSVNHIYYRWKMYSILQGDTITNWSTKKFRMFKGGSIWIPPPIPNYFDGMPDELIQKPVNIKQMLSDAQMSRLIEHIQQLSLKRTKIGEAMIFCLNHGEASKTIVEIISSSFEKASTNPIKKVARLYLISDILYNAGMKKMAQYGYREEFKKHLVTILESMKKTFSTTKLSADKNAIKVRVTNVLKMWDLWKIYDKDFLKKLEQSFDVEDLHDEDSCGEEPLDGNMLIQRSLMNYDSAKNCVIINKENCAEPKTLDIPEEAEEESSSYSSIKNPLVDYPMDGFIPSKWECIDPEVVESQAMSTQKFIDLEYELNSKEKVDEEVEDEKRERLRHIEVLVMRYQDELESGSEKIKKGYTVEELVDDYRRKLMKKKRLSDKTEESSPDSSNSRESRKFKKDKNRKSKSTSERKKHSEKDQRHNSKYASTSRRR